MDVIIPGDFKVVHIEEGFCFKCVRINKVSLYLPKLLKSYLYYFNSRAGSFVWFS